MADGGGGLTFRAIPLEEAIRHSATERLYHPEGPLGPQEVARGIALLQEAALDIPVYLVRLEAGYVQRTLGQVRAELVREGRLIPGVTGYAAAFEKDGQRVLVIVSRGPLRRPAKAEPVVWRRRDYADPDLDTSPSAPPPLPPEPHPYKNRRSKGNPETRRASKKARQKRRAQE